MHRHFRSLATLMTIAIFLTFLVPRFVPNAAAFASTDDAPRAVAQTTRFGALGIPTAALDAAPGAREAFGRDAEIVPVARPRTILVVGGTPAGVAAALAAARRGAEVTLVSETPDLGGVLTSAMMDQWDLNRAPGGRILEGGIFSEMLARLGDVFDPADAARTFASMLAAESRVHLVANERPVAVRLSSAGRERRIDEVTFRDERTGERETLGADVVVDATDAADVAAEAGARYDIGRQDTGIDERTQSVTLMFALRGVDWIALANSYDFERYGTGYATSRRAWGYARLAARYRPLDPNAIVRDLNFGRMNDGTVTVNAVDLCNVDALSVADRARATVVARRESYALVAFLRANLRGFAGATIERFAPSLYVRETRHVGGLERLTTSDIWSGKIPPDTIGLSSYPIDLHPVEPNEWPAFASGRHVYGIPLGTLIPRGFANVVLASPSISATHLASGSARVVPTTVEEGEAAGVAASIAVRSGLTLPTIATSPAELLELRSELASEGVILAPPPGSLPPAPRFAGTRAMWEVLAPPG